MPDQSQMATWLTATITVLWLAATMTRGLTGKEIEAARILDGVFPTVVIFWFTTARKGNGQ